MKLCIECKHFRSGGRTGDSSCRSPRAKDYAEPVYGMLPSPGQLRDNVHRCGLHGAWFEPKPAPQPEPEPTPRASRWSWFA